MTLTIRSGRPSWIRTSGSTATPIRSTTSSRTHPDPSAFIHAELHGKDAFNAKWLTAITTTLRDHRGWGVEIGNIPDSFVVIFSKRLLVRGRKLAKCKTAADVVQVAAPAGTRQQALVAVLEVAAGADL